MLDHWRPSRWTVGQEEEKQKMRGSHVQVSVTEYPLFLCTVFICLFVYMVNEREGAFRPFVSLSVHCLMNGLWLFMFLGLISGKRKGKTTNFAIAAL